MLRWKARGDGILRDVVAMTIAAAAALVPCTLVAAAFAASPLVGVACGVAGALTLFAGVKFVRPEIRLLPGATAAALSGAALGLAFPVSPALACLSFGALFGLAQASGHRAWGDKLGIIATTAAAALVGAAVFGQAVALLGTAAFTTPLAAAGLSGLFGTYMALGTLPAHVKARRELVGEAYAQLAPGLAGEARDHMQRTHALYQRIQDALVPGEKLTEEQEEMLSRDVERAALALFDQAVKLSILDRDAPEDVAPRLRQLDAQIAGCSDPAARATFEETRRALQARAGDQGAHRAARDRLAATLGLDHTRLESVYAALVRLRSASDTAPALEALTSALEETARLPPASSLQPPA